MENNIAFIDYYSMSRLNVVGVRQITTGTTSLSKTFQLNYATPTHLFTFFTFHAFSSSLATSTLKKKDMRFCKICFYSATAVLRWACLSVLRNHKSKRHQIFCVHLCCLWLWLGHSVAKLNTLCTSGFVDDIMFSTAASQQSHCSVVHAAW